MRREELTGAPDAMPVEPGAHLETAQRARGEDAQDVLLRAEFLNPQAPEHVLRELERAWCGPT